MASITAYRQSRSQVAQRFIIFVYNVYHGNPIQCEYKWQECNGYLQHGKASGLLIWLGWNRHNRSKGSRSRKTKADGSLFQCFVSLAKYWMGSSVQRHIWSWWGLEPAKLLRDLMEIKSRRDLSWFIDAIKKTGLHTGIQSDGPSDWRKCLIMGSGHITNIWERDSRKRRRAAEHGENQNDENCFRWRYLGKVRRSKGKCGRGLMIY